MLEVAGLQVQDELELGAGPEGAVARYLCARRCAPRRTPLAERHAVRVRFPAGHYHSPQSDTAALGSETERLRVWPDERSGAARDLREPLSASPLRVRI